MLALCKEYDTRRGIFTTGSEYFFPASDGNPLTKAQLGRIMKQCWESANPKTDPSSLPRVRVYDLRHRYASAVLIRWLDQKKNLNNMLPYLRAYMGHDKLSETAYYIHILPENLIKSSGIDWEVFNSIIPEVVLWPE
jgi:integrase